MLNPSGSVSKLLIKIPRGASVAPMSLRILRRRTASNRDTAPDQSAARQSSTGVTSAKETTEIILPPAYPPITS